MAHVFEYQQAGIDFMRSRPRVLNADEPGLGKTRQSLLSAEGRTLVIAPAVLRDMRVWEDERDKWRPDLNLTVAAYHDVVEREGRKHTGRISPKVRGSWDTLIFDEAHNLKGRKSQWTDVSIRLAVDIERVFLLTGTPIPNWAHEIFTLLKILRPDEAKRGGPLGSYWRWAQKWFKSEPTRYSQWNISTELKACDPTCATLPPHETCAHWQAFHRSEFGDRFIRRLRDDVLTELPPLLGGDDLLIVPMVPQQQRAYDQLKSDMLATLDSGEQIAAWSSAGQITRLRQLSTALETVSQTYASGKLDAMEELLIGRSRPALVVGHFQSTLDAIEKRLDRLGLRWAEVSGRVSDPRKRMKAKDAFQAGQLDVLVGQVDTVAEGLTLTAGDLLIMVEHSWRPSKNTQVMRRLHRPGQERPVTVRRLVSPGIDAEMQELLRAKTEHQARAMPARDFADML